MPKPDENDEQVLAVARQHMARYHITLSVLAQGENSPCMTEEFKRELVEAKKKLEPYTISGRATKAD